MSDPLEPAPVPARRFAWLRAASDRVPTKWFAGIATGLFLVATAAFGGLATAAPPDIVRLQPGTPHVTDQRSLSVERAVLIDELPEAGVYPEEGERVLALIVEVENRWDEPLRTAGPHGVTVSFTVEGIEDPSPDVARMDDATSILYLQPRVPAELVYAWTVDADAFAGGDELTVELADTSLYTGSFVTEGQSWGDPVTEAEVALPIDDVGAGADTEPGDGE